MTSDAFTGLEANFKIELPQEYLDVMHSYPFPDGHFGVEMLADDAKVLEQRNRPVFSKRARAKFWPSLSDGYFWIGSDGSEFSFYVKLGRESCGVWYYDIETGKVQKYCDSVGDYIQKCKKVDADEEHLPNETASSPAPPLWKQKLYVFALLAGIVLFGCCIVALVTLLLHHILKW